MFLIWAIGYYSKSQLLAFSAPSLKVCSRWTCSVCSTCLWRWKHGPGIKCITKDINTHTHTKMSAYYTEQLWKLQGQHQLQHAVFRFLTYFCFHCSWQVKGQRGFMAPISVNLQISMVAHHRRGSAEISTKGNSGVMSTNRWHRGAIIPQGGAEVRD